MAVKIWYGNESYTPHGPLEAFHIKDNQYCIVDENWLSFIKWDEKKNGLLVVEAEPLAVSRFVPNKKFAWTKE